jgi:lipid-A-disaccharide synthase
MLEAAELLLANHPDALFVVPVAPTLDRALLAPWLAAHPGLDVRLVDGRTEEVVGASDGSLVKSGTSALEAGLMQRPMVVTYKVSWPTYVVGKLLVKVAHYSLVNLLVGREVVRELIQGAATGPRLAEELERVLADGAARTAQLAGLLEVRAKLGTPGAPERVAQQIVEVIEQ